MEEGLDYLQSSIHPPLVIGNQRLDDLAVNRVQIARFAEMAPPGGGHPHQQMPQAGFLVFHFPLAGYPEPFSSAAMRLNLGHIIFWGRTANSFLCLPSAVPVRRRRR